VPLRGLQHNGSALYLDRERREQISRRQSNSVTEVSGQVMMDDDTLDVAVRIKHIMLIRITSLSY
jgi:hypothetical protein